MAVTVHFLMRTEHLPEGSSELSLIAELAALRYVRGRHTGEHLAETFMQVVTDLGVLHKVLEYFIIHSGTCHLRSRS